MTDNQDNVATKVDAAAGSPNMAPATVVWLVARREMWAKLRDKGFLLSTGFILVAILASAILPAALSDDSPTYDVGVVGSIAELEPVVQARAEAEGAEVDLRSTTTRMRPEARSKPRRSRRPSTATRSSWTANSPPPSNGS